MFFIILTLAFLWGSIPAVAWSNYLEENAEAQYYILPDGQKSNTYTYPIFKLLIFLYPFDVLKGFILLMLLKIAGSSDLTIFLSFSSFILGHAFSPWQKFRYFNVHYLFWGFWFYISFFYFIFISLIIAGNKYLGVPKDKSFLIANLLTIFYLFFINFNAGHISISLVFFIIQGIEFALKSYAEQRNSYKI